MHGDYFAEIREFGEGIIAVEQSANLIKNVMPQALTNFNTIFAFASPYGGDKSVLGKIMGLDEYQKDFLTNLPVGCCIAKLPAYPPELLETYEFEELVGQPPVTIVPKKETTSPPPLEETEEKVLLHLSTTTLSDQESALLEDVYNFPTSLTVERALLRDLVSGGVPFTRRGQG